MNAIFTLFYDIEYFIQSVCYSIVDFQSTAGSEPTIRDRENYWAKKTIEIILVKRTVYKNISIVKLAEELVKPFGLRVLTSVIDSPIDKFAVKPGEFVFEALDRAARLQGFLFVSTRGGNIRLTKAATSEARFRAFSSLEQGVNLIGGRATFDDSKRHNTYKVIGQAAGKDDFFGAEVAQPKGTATDAGVSRHRPLTIIAEGSVDNMPTTG